MVEPVSFEEIKRLRESSDLVDVIVEQLNGELLECELAKAEHHTQPYDFEHLKWSHTADDLYEAFDEAVARFIDAGWVVKQGTSGDEPYAIFMLPAPKRVDRSESSKPSSWWQRLFG